MSLNKQTEFKHGVSELGNLQTYKIVKIVKDGEVINKNMSKPYTPADVNNMDGFDEKSKEVVAAITTKEAKTEFEAEKQPITGTGLEETYSWDRMIDEEGRIAVRRIHRVFEDGKEISKKYHRSWIIPGDDFSKSDAISKALAKKFHTAKIIKDYKDKIKEQEKEMEKNEGI